MRVYLTMAVTLLASAACTKPPKAGAAAQTHQGMVMVPDTSGTELRSPSPDRTGMILMMQAHIDSMARMGPEQISRMMPRHEQLMSQMMDQMGPEMRQMSAPKGWSALADSVRQDLAELPNLSGQALSSRMQAHAERVRRLIALHKRKMLGM